MPEALTRFDPGPDIELRPLTSPKDTAKSSLRAETQPTATLYKRWMHYLREWGWEMAACLCSLIGYCGIVGLLIAFDGKTQPAWRYGITLNSAVALLSTITKGFLLVPAAACISQSIWINYAKKEHSLGILTTYDAASRGPWGALQLLWVLRSRRLACLGAALTVLAVGIGPAVQQTIVIETRSTLTRHPATIARARSYSQTLTRVHGPGKYDPETLDIIPLELSGLLYSGIYLNSRRLGTLDVVPDCPTNDCRFPRFDSLAVCSSCEDHTQMIEKSCFTSKTSWKPKSYGKNVTYCNFSLPNGLRINQSLSDASTIAASVQPRDRSSEEPDVINVSVLNASASDLNASAEAVESSLSWCVKTYEAAVVNDSLVEHEVQSQRTWTVSGLSWNMSLPGHSKSSASQFTVWRTPSFSIYNYLRQRFTFSNSRYVEWLDRFADEDSFMFSADTTSNFSFDAPPAAILWDTLEMVNAVGSKEMFSNIAKAMTTFIRTDGNNQEQAIKSDDIMFDLSPMEPVVGTAWTLEVYIRVRWPWLTFLGFILLLTIVFLVLTIHQSFKYKVAAWKSEPLALMYHGLESNKEDDQCFDNVGDMQKHSTKVKVRLQETESGLRLAESDA
ncbi:hypothetical protein ST47_g4323 [Ascochyta rabiei]|uniref:Uncharacterized protein n=1 Tax=Didymella rabiei TaxID=5454 RepID=A0A163FV80_DIDRA|nr:hypothetical protein ST47_g4323 [Ascochyta rabiei]